jgi:hypothetical protein
MIRLKEVAAAEALALDRTLHWQTQKFEPPSQQDHSFEAEQNPGKKEHDENVRTKCIKAVC